MGVMCHISGRTHNRDKVWHNMSLWGLTTTKAKITNNISYRRRRSGHQEQYCTHTRDHVTVLLDAH